MTFLFSRLRYGCYFWCACDNQGRSGPERALGWTKGGDVLSGSFRFYVLFSSVGVLRGVILQEFITSATTLGALLGGLTAGAMSDWTGRRLVLGIADVIFIGGAIGQAVCHTVWSMVSIPNLLVFRFSIPISSFISQIGGRFLIGIGVGLASCIAPLYIQELSPTRLRGRMVVLNVVMITLGQVIAYGIDAGFENTNGGWRWMVGLSAVPAGLQLAVLAFLPESREHLAACTE